MLDNELRAILTFSRSGSYSSFEGSDILQVRKNVRLLSSITALPPVGVESIQDHDLPTDGGCSIRLRLYRPALDIAEVPALLYFHGGGFVLYDIEDYDTFCRYMAVTAGIVVIAVNYRRAPEYRFPAAHTDALAALSWLSDNARALHIDRERIAVGGDSVGGNLAAFLANTCQQATLPCLQLLIYPVLLFNRVFPSYEQYGSGYFLDKRMMQWFWSLFADPDLPMDEDERVSPYLKTDLHGVAPAVMVVAGYDILRDEALEYHKRLMQQGNKGTLLHFNNLGHNFILFGGRVKACRLAIQEIVTIVKDRLHNKTTF